jgi:glycosyltransferase involved in cell wall biosynthesis
MTAPALEFVVPGDLHAATGGYVYDRAVVDGLRTRGWRVTVHRLDESFPSPTAGAVEQAERVFSGLPDRACTLVDGMALGAIPDIVAHHARRLTLVALIHMPLAAQFNIQTSIAERLRAQELCSVRAVRHIIVTSRRIQRELTTAGIGPSVISVIEPGVPPEWRLPELPPVSSRGAATPYDRPPCDGGLELLCVATVHAGKGHHLLLSALGRLTHFPWHLKCVGSLSHSTSTVQSLRQQIDRLGLAERVTFVGSRPHTELSDFYRTVDLFVLPTLRETYCMAVAEALAHALPVISSRTGAIEELVGTTAGLLVDPGDGEGLFAALERAISDEALRRSLRKGALEARSRLTSWPQTCDRMSDVLTRALQDALHGSQ